MTSCYMTGTLDGGITHRRAREQQPAIAVVLGQPDLEAGGVSSVGNEGLASVARRELRELCDHALPEILARLARCGRVSTPRSAGDADL